MPDFARRHYETIAAALAAERAEYGPRLALDEASVTPETEAADAACDTLANLATRLADAFERDNPNFNRVRFLLAADCEDTKP